MIGKDARTVAQALVWVLGEVDVDLLSLGAGEIKSAREASDRILRSQTQHCGDCDTPQPGFDVCPDCGAECLPF